MEEQQETLNEATLKLFDLCDHPEQVTEEAIRKLVTQGAVVNAKMSLNKYHKDWTPLHTAASHRRNLVAIQTLHDLGGNIDAQTSLGITPAMIAAGRATDKITIRLLAKLRADLNKKDNDGLTALAQIAPYSEYKEMIKNLITLGADPYIKDNRGWTICYIAVERTNNVKGLFALVEAGADPYQKNDGELGTDADAGHTAFDMLYHKGPERLVVIRKYQQNCYKRLLLLAKLGRLKTHE